jgi:anti-sigma B factor antagonist
VRACSAVDSTAVRCTRRARCQRLFTQATPLPINAIRRRQRVQSRSLAGPPPRVITVEPFDAQGVAIVVDGDLDLDTALQLETALANVIAEGHRHLVVDLTTATFLDSVAMGTLLRSLRPLRHDPAAAVVLSGARGIVQRSLEVSGVGHMFTQFEDCHAAIGGLTDATAQLDDQWRSVSQHV